jgi:hypothetical protein
MALSFPAGTFTALGGPSTCSMTGASNATLATGKITGTITLTWSSTCVGTVAQQATETNQLSLTKS